MGLVLGRALYEGVLLDLPLAPFFVSRLQVVGWLVRSWAGWRAALVQQGAGVGGSRVLVPGQAGRAGGVADARHAANFLATVRCLPLCPSPIIACTPSVRT